MKSKSLKIFLYTILAVTVSFGYALSQQNNRNKVFNPLTDRVEVKHEFRGAWLTTVRGSDWPRKIRVNLKRLPKESHHQQKLRIERQRDSQKIALVDVITKIKETGCNVVIMQLCCNSEAYYKSKILPWDHNLTGVQGEDPGYDPLKLAIETAHSLGMQIHGWFNPMRVGSVESQRVKKHPCFKHPDRVIKYGKTMYWNPGHPEVIQYLYDVIYEVMSNYDLDGAHIDDFFYPEGLREKLEVLPKLRDSLKTLTDKNEIAELKKTINKLNDGKVWDDAAYYNKYGQGMELGRWREENVNKIVAAMYKAVHDAKPNAIFGVSPGGRLVNTQKLYADPQYWIAEGTIDYLAPQIYWQHGHRIADFKKVLDSWKPIMKGVPCLPGLAAYRYKEKGFDTMDEFVLQVAECRDEDFVQGNIWFTTHSLFRPDFLDCLKNNIYRYPSLIPELGTSLDIAPAPVTVTEKDGVIRWDKSPAAKSYAVYKLYISSYSPDGFSATWRGGLIGQTEDTEFTAPEKEENYVVIAINGKEKSSPSNVVFVR